MKADLHVHSTASDGSASPAELVSLAVDGRLDVLAIADHDSVEGVEEAASAAGSTSVRLVPALELSAFIDGRDVHVLGYYVDHRDPDLTARLGELRHARLQRARRMVGALREDGLLVSLDDVLALSDGGAVGRSHVARALVRAGHAADVSDAFGRLIGRGRPYYVAKDACSPAEAIALIRRAGGLAVLAHPGVNRLDDLVEGLVGAGLAGIEAYHADHTPEQRAHYAALAASFGLVATGGSDYHGAGAPNPPLGSVDIPDSAIEAFLAWPSRFA